MTKTAGFLLFGVLLAATSPGIRDEADASGWRSKRAHAATVYNPPRARRLYWVYRSPRFVPPPPTPEIFTFECCLTNRVNTHMY
ncbi:hypothetical protein KKP04_06700 [Rhodomicrobium sp. Az07]|uniref:hypothetical protein n=1 Tax=Rhodomicrobium sp. Az07 TaxID=2839034 RepID=UPI001BE67D78|nr:hypothetical protein [Rhodomicrobium sp. Az07]MBT3070553.1 hypothetical protein [Rhodomicrobium sp. Az07]